MSDILDIAVNLLEPELTHEDLGEGAEQWLPASMVEALHRIADGLQERLIEGWGPWRLDGCRLVAGNVSLCWVSAKLRGEVTAETLMDLTEALRDVKHAHQIGLIDRACACGREETE